MRISVIKLYSIKNIILPENAQGVYWVDGIDLNGNRTNLISIEAENGKWKLISNKEVYYIKNNVMEPSAYLEVGKFYYVKNDIDNSIFILYCSPVIENYNCYEINEYIEKGLLIGSKSSANINYSNLDKESCLIKKEDNKLYIYVYDTKNGIYVNNFRILKKAEIKIGDVIFIVGLRIMVSMTTNNGFALYVNNGTINSINTNMIPLGMIGSMYSDFTEPATEIEYPIYNDNDYFYKKPRIVPVINTLNLKIDAPPAKQEEKESPFLLTIGPMATMSMTSLIMGYQSLNNVMNGTATLKQVTPSLIICGAMFASIFVWPLFTRWYQKYERLSKERKRQKKYRKYIDSKKEEIEINKHSQEEALNMYYQDTSKAADIILHKNPALWQKRKDDIDFLTVNVGTGNYPMRISINYPEEGFSMDEDNLKKMLNELGSTPKTLENVAIPYSFKNNFISGVFGLSSLHNLIRRLLIQILAFHSYDDLKIVILTDEEREHEWSFLKLAPHIFTDDKSLRFFATNNDEYKEVCYYLNKVFESRKNDDQSVSDNEINKNNQSYLIITDCLKKVREYDILKNILNNKEYSGFSLLILEQKMTNLPDQCTSFIDMSLLSNKYHECEIRNSLNPEESIKFVPDLDSIIDYEACVKVLANIPIDIKNDAEGKLPNKIGFLEMYDVGKVEQLNSPLRWKRNNPILNLSTPVGVGKNEELIAIDLHEKYHGPHGLIAGMTGSGKSEFIITYILSMAINYHPYEVQFILIDYKGGGLAGAFENKLTGLKLPHLVGTITNLDANEIKRSLASIESELKRRQSLFNKAREISGESTIDIYKYQKMFREGTITEPVSHLFIICDEFAELKNQQPEFMDELISTARIGRSLGVHLILATQKPSGVVDPQIWSNTRFRVCLRVQDTSDSNEVIKKADAAYLKQTGRFYFQVGYDEVFILGQAAYAGGKYIPHEKVSKELNTSIDFINNIGYITKKINTKIKKEEVVNASGEELINIVKYLESIAREQNIVTKPLWLEKIPAFITVDGLASKYNYKAEKFNVNPIIGEYDIPNKQEQRLLTIPLSNQGNALIYGAAGSGKENFITSMIYASIVNYTPEEVNYYIIDFGSGALNMFRNSYLVGDILASGEDEKVNNLFKMIVATINERKALFADYNGSYESYIKNSNRKIPNIVIIINNYESFAEVYDNLTENLGVLARESTKYGIYFVLTVTTPNGIRYKLRQSFSLTYTLNQNNEDDYMVIMGNVNKNYPAKLFGRGLIKMDEVFEFQTAMVSEKDTITESVKNKIRITNSLYRIKANKIPVLPNIVTLNEIKNYLSNKEVVIGINKANLNACTFNFNRYLINIISTLDLLSVSKFLYPLLNQIVYQKIANVMVINAGEIELQKGSYQYTDKDFDKTFTKLNEFVNSNYEKYVNNNFNKDIFADNQKIYCVIIGIDSFRNKLSQENMKAFDKMMNNAKDLDIIKFIIVDSVDKIRKIEMENWYRTSANGNFGIWIGNGINDQYSVKVAQKIPEMKEDIPSNFCFVVKAGKPSYVKFVESFEVAEETTETL